MAIIIPSLPVQHRDFLHHIRSHPNTSIQELVKPFNDFDVVARKIFAQDSSQTLRKENCVNVVPLYSETTKDADIRIRARDLNSESLQQKEKYLLPLSPSKRRGHGSPAVVPSLEEFQKNFALFTEGALSDLDWSNVVAAGSAVVTSLLPVPKKYQNSKRGLRQYYHDEFAPASDVDLFLYGLNEEQAIEKIKQIEDKIRNTILYETTTIRTKNAITIASQYPTRHVQIVLRVYHSVSEILTGFDVDCSCAAYDGKQVYASPRAIAAFITQTNQVDLTRRSPSYENRLSKYSHRGFEVFWPLLDRSKVDPTIFERNFTRTEGLARLLILEKLPKSEDRDSYLAKRREERGRPPLSLYLRRRQGRELRGNIKDDWEDEVPDWQEEDQISDYHTFTIPYGKRFNARKIEKMLYTKDLLLNAEWNQDRSRDVYLHRHPAFFGDAEDVIGDCCGACPQPITEEEQKIAEEDNKKYVSGKISFIKDNPGRQEIGSFNPITETDWTAMAYIGSTEKLCQAIVSHDLEAVKSLLSQEGVDPDRRDYSGRTPLQLACMSSTPEIVQCLVDHDARLIARMADGQTALHLAATRGDIEIVRILLKRSNENQEAEDKKTKQSAPEQLKSAEDVDGMDVDDDEDVDEMEQPNDHASRTSASYVKIEMDPKGEVSATHDTIEENDLDPDVYDINVTAWDNLASPLHLAILHGHVETVKELVTSFGADVSMPIKIRDDYNQRAKAAILTLVLVLALPLDKAKEMSQALLNLGASPAQGDVNRHTPIDYIAQTDYLELLDVYLEHDGPAVQRAINHNVVKNDSWYGSRADISSPLVNALCAHNPEGVTKLLELGAKPSFTLSDYLDALKSQGKTANDIGGEQKIAEKKIKQPLIFAIENDLPLVAIELLNRGVDLNCEYEQSYSSYQTALDATKHRLAELDNELNETPNIHIPYGTPDPVILEKNDEDYLTGIEDGTYKMLASKGLIRKAKKDNKKYEEVTERQKADALKQREREAEKRKKSEALTQNYKLLETELLSRGAKTWAELHPGEHSNPFPIHTRHRQQAKKPAQPFELKLFKTYLNFDAATYDGYVEMFEAAWRGDLDKIKSFTLQMWGPEKDRKPLILSQTDALGNSCLHIAIVRGHLRVAKGILKILQAQCKVKESETRKRFDMDSDTDTDFSDDDEDLRIVGRVVDEQFTHDDIGTKSSQVESNYSPRQVLQFSFPVDLFSEELFNQKRHNIVAMSKWAGWAMEVCTLFQYAIHKNDLGLLEWLIRAGHECASTDSSDKNPFSLQQADFQLAMILGHIECLSLMIQKTAVGLPLENMSKKSGIAAPEEHEYYQGLSIRGKKRKDWASAGRPENERQTRGTQEVGRSPVLISALLGKLASTEWFLGTAPGRYYLEYVNQHATDEAVQRLSKSRLGLEASVMQWLQTRNELVLHCAVMSRPCDESEKLVQFLVDQHPECLEARSSEGYTPLALALSLRRLKFAQILIEAGANQAVRDAQGRNPLHMILCSTQMGVMRLPGQASALIDLLNKEQVLAMLTQRAGQGSKTPFADWIHKRGALSPLEPPSENPNEPSDWHNARQIVKIFLDLGESSSYRFLELLDGAGNTIAHDCVKLCFPQILDWILDRRPDLLYRENATGTTPLEMAVSAWVNETTRNPPEIASQRDRWHYSRFQKATSYKFKSNVTDESEKTTSQIMLEACRKRATRNPAKRRLVTLYEANEVTKRLADSGNSSGRGYRASRFGRRYGRYGGDEEKELEMDEVALWGQWAAQWNQSTSDA
ncbi:hypothetical protein PDE_07708 [Penicillium oxalicum 114-2]|uniref:Ankyrin repeat protein n=1 Tax=Penicillium oxalicum (strain 114-2 / CGMCC 5302) TaxID=933388 RepID=S8B1Q0_PENO1|nr:hypothetical protein PDE_07708 [Penicillium oxalicum 114-2]